MLSFDIRALEEKAAAVEGELAADDPIWEEGDPRPQGPIRVTGRLSAAGAGRFYFSGQIAGTAAGECRRCLTDVLTPVAVDAHLIFAEVGLDEADDESDEYPFDPGDRSLDLRPAVREEWLLAAPAFPLCREDCRGLCPQCGADLNQDPTHSHAATDSRWDALRDALGGNARDGRGSGPASD
jgi:uncharacterized protein